MKLKELQDVACFTLETKRKSNNDLEIIAKLKNIVSGKIIGEVKNTLNIIETNNMIEASESYGSINEVTWEGIISSTKIMLINHVLNIYGVDDFHLEQPKDIDMLTCDINNF